MKCTFGNFIQHFHLGLPVEHDRNWYSYFQPKTVVGQEWNMGYE
jgi:hypothetical protein